MKIGNIFLIQHTTYSDFLKNKTKPEFNDILIYYYVSQ
jgi:hypothetical protein